jgi:hypothetical protein
MAERYVNSFSASNGIVTLTIAAGHGLSVGDYFSVRNINSDVNGQFFVLSTPSSTILTYDNEDPSYTIAETPTGTIEAKIIYTSFNNTGKPGYIYDEPNDVWYQISGKVNTNGNYTWTGTHLHQAPVTMEDILILDNLSASPSASPVGGGYLYVENGALKFMGGNGTITTIAPE